MHLTLVVCCSTCSDVVGSLVLLTVKNKCFLVPAPQDVWLDMLLSGFVQFSAVTAAELQSTVDGQNPA